MAQRGIMSTAKSTIHVCLQGRVPVRREAGGRSPEAETHGEHGDGGQVAVGRRRRHRRGPQTEAETRPRLATHPAAHREEGLFCCCCRREGCCWQPGRAGGRRRGGRAGPQEGQKMTGSTLSNESFIQIFIHSDVPSYTLSDSGILS